MSSVLSNAGDYILSLLLSLPGLVMAMCLHEYAHAQMSVWLGDPTPKATGRLSLNPFHHLDPIGLLMLFVLRFGWAKPVLINPRCYKRPKLGTALTSLAGPAMNLLAAFVLGAAVGGLAILFNTVGAALSSFMQTVIEVTYTMAYLALLLNVGLALFNLIPVPPLDGSKVLMSFLPRSACEWMIRNERWCYLTLILLMFNIPGRLLGYVGVPVSVTAWLDLSNYLGIVREWIVSGIEAFWTILFTL